MIREMHRSLYAGLVVAAVLVIFTVPVVNERLPARLLLLVLLGAAIFACVLPTGREGARILALTIIGVTSAVAIIAALDPVNPVDRSNMQRFLVLFPLAFVLGYLTSRGYVQLFGRVVLTLATSFSLLSCVEFVLGVSLFGRGSDYEWLQQGGRSRALLGAEHSLVLGVLLASAIPTVLLLRNQSRRVALAAVLLAGVWCTNSRGALAFAVILAAYIAVSSDKRDRLLSKRWVVLTSVVAALGLTYMSIAVWQPQTTSLDWSENSAQYRPAMYALLPSILGQIPFGYGLGELPLGVWLVEAPTGASDVAHSADSQLVLGAMRLGVLGVALFIWVWHLAIRSWRVNQISSMMLLTVTASGLFLALDAWDGLGAYWLLLIGVCYGSVRGSAVQSGIGASRSVSSEKSLESHLQRRGAGHKVDHS